MSFYEAIFLALSLSRLDTRFGALLLGLSYHWLVYRPNCFCASLSLSLLPSLLPSLPPYIPPPTFSLSLSLSFLTILFSFCCKNTFLFEIMIASIDL